MQLTVTIETTYMGPCNDDLTQVWSKCSCKFMFFFEKVCKLKWNMNAAKAQVSMRGNQVF